ncbi:hypothetical protein CHS0354_029663, partial [Potamilus streckersoni]
ALPVSPPNEICSFRDMHFNNAGIVSAAPRLVIKFVTNLNDREVVKRFIEYIYGVISILPDKDVDSDGRVTVLKIGNFRALI